MRPLRLKPLATAAMLAVVALTGTACVYEPEGTYVAYRDRDDWHHHGWGWRDHDWHRGWGWRD